MFGLHSGCVHGWIVHTGTASSTRSIWLEKLVARLNNSLLRNLLLTRRSPPLVLVKLQLLRRLFLVNATIARAIVVSWDQFVTIGAIGWVWVLKLGDQVWIRSVRTIPVRSSS